MDMEDLRKEFVARIAKLGGKVFRASRLQGLPEMMVVIPGGRIGFVEVISESERAPVLLKNRIKELRTLGCAACVLTDEKEIDSAIMYILTDAGKDPDWYIYKLEKSRLEAEKQANKELKPQ